MTDTPHLSSSEVKPCQTREQHCSCYHNSTAATSSAIAGVCCYCGTRQLAVRTPKPAPDPFTMPSGTTNPVKFSLPDPVKLELQRLLQRAREGNDLAFSSIMEIMSQALRGNVTAMKQKGYLLHLCGGILPSPPSGTTNPPQGLPAMKFNKPFVLMANDKYRLVMMTGEADNVTSPMSLTIDEAGTDSMGEPVWTQRETINRLTDVALLDSLYAQRSALVQLQEAVTSAEAAYGVVTAMENPTVASRQTVQEYLNEAQRLLAGLVFR